MNWPGLGRTCEKINRDCDMPEMNYYGCIWYEHGHRRTSKETLVKMTPLAGSSKGC